MIECFMRIACLVFLIFISLDLKSQTTYIIQRGETIELIASRYGISVKCLKEANSLLNEYYTGLTINIPPRPVSVTDNDNKYNEIDKVVLPRKKSKWKNFWSTLLGGVTDVVSSNYGHMNPSNYGIPMMYGYNTPMSYTDNVCLNSAIAVAESSNRMNVEFNNMMSSINNQWNNLSASFPPPVFVGSDVPMPMNNTSFVNSDANEFNSNTSNANYSYEDTYRRYERLAESHYNSLTTLGYRSQNSNGISGGTGDMTNVGGSIVTMKMNLLNAQKEMRRVRQEAAQNGVIIQQSHWETATVTIN